jgi:outer membrane receptor protein involved in Fe transport
MRWGDHGRSRAWLFVFAIALIPFGAGAQDEDLDDDRGEYEAPDASVEDELPDVSADEEPFAGVEEITVTVQKRSQSLQKVPAAASAITGRQLDAAGIVQMQDVQSFVPNMHYGQERGEAKITIRGVSNAQGTDQSTAVHTDGIFQNRARSITAFTFFDIQRVEILRGPQGTLYGRNATGGAMNIISVPPSDKFEILADFQIGNYDQLMGRGVLNVPLVEDLAALRVSGFWEDRDGYQENLNFSGSDQDADDAEDFGIRSQLLLTPHDLVDLTLRFNYASKRGVGYALKRDGPLPDSVELVPGFPPLDQQPIYDGATPNPDNDRHAFLDTKGDIDNETISGNANFEWQVPKIPFFGATKLRVLGSYTDFDDDSVIDQDYSDLQLAVANQSWEGNEWVAEIDWSSDYGENAGWLLGIFHLGTTGDMVVDAPSIIPILTPQNTRFNIPVPFYQDFDRSAYSLAGFVNGWYHLTEKLRVEAGVRYSHDWKKSHLESPTIFLREEGQPPTPFVLFQGIDDDRSDDWGEPTGSFSLDYPITDESLLYGRFSTGYKAGTLNNDIAPIGGTLGDEDCDPDPDAPDCDGIFSPADADPENLFALEAGLKNTMLLVPRSAGEPAIRGPELRRKRSGRAHLWHRVGVHLDPCRIAHARSPVFIPGHGLHRLQGLPRCKGFLGAGLHGKRTLARTTLFGQLQRDVPFRPRSLRQRDALCADLRIGQGLLSADQRAGRYPGCLLPAELSPRLAERGPSAGSGRLRRQRHRQRRVHDQDRRVESARLATRRRL